MLLNIKKQTIKNADELYNYYLYEIKPNLTEYDLYKEHLIVLGLDKRFNLSFCDIAAIGTNNNVTANIKDLIRYPVLYNAKYVLLIHNHPNNNEPSEPDIEITKEWGRAMMGIGIKLNEHIVIKKDGYTSIVEIIKERKKSKIKITYKDYLTEEYYLKDPKVKKYESFENWLDDQDIDSIVEWADSYVKDKK